MYGELFQPVSNRIDRRRFLGAAASAALVGTGWTESVRATRQETPRAGEFGELDATAEGGD